MTYSRNSKIFQDFVWKENTAWLCRRMTLFLNFLFYNFKGGDSQQFIFRMFETNRQFWHELGGRSRRVSSTFSGYVFFSFQTPRQAGRTALEKMDFEQDFLPWFFDLWRRSIVYNFDGFVWILILTLYYRNFKIILHATMK